MKLSIRKSEGHYLSAIKFTVILAVFGFVVGAFGAALTDWNEQRFGAEVSSYRFEWFTALAAPGTAIASMLIGEDRQLGSTSYSEIFSIAVLNGISYLLASLVVRMFLLVLKRRS